MPNQFFQFKQFTIHQEHCSMKVTTDACLFGAWAASHIEKESAVKNILDIGAGTGLLSLMVAQKTFASIDAIEIQQKDYLQGLQNIAQSPWHHNIHLHHTDAKNFNYEILYDVIISNPPFYNNDLKSANAGKNIAHHHYALELTSLLKIIKQNLNLTGKFFILLPHRRLAEAKQMIQTAGLFITTVVEVYPTENSKPTRIMLAGGHEPAEVYKEKIIIKDRNEYSASFRCILKDFYLQL